MSPGSSTESYPAFARIGLRENPGKNLNQVTCPDRDSNPGHLVSQPDALTVTPQFLSLESEPYYLPETDLRKVFPHYVAVDRQSQIATDNTYYTRSVLPTRFLKIRCEAVQKPLNCYIVNVKLYYFAANTHSLTLHYTTRTHPHRKQNKRRQDQQRPVLRMTHKRSKPAHLNAIDLGRDRTRNLERRKPALYQLRYRDLKVICDNRQATNFECTLTPCDLNCGFLLTNSDVYYANQDFRYNSCKVDLNNFEGKIVPEPGIEPGTFGLTYQRSVSVRVPG
ncbi:hypothetical protein ANN_21562 [Periplaneta americana]|uniref:Uncharacterized protein n=1 Tax=Periplaneta americana TaxID=6978 RepID=A0ABQ8S6M5_PERAM|nr:hypothetical protein ANN_21562 [Periplaneta americana]